MKPFRFFKISEANTKGDRQEFVSLKSAAKNACKNIMRFLASCIRIIMSKYGKHNNAKNKERKKEQGYGCESNGKAKAYQIVTILFSKSNGSIDLKNPIKIITELNYSELPEEYRRIIV